MQTDSQTEKKRDQKKPEQKIGRRKWGYALLIAAAAGILAGAFFLPIFRIYGDAMAPTFHKGEIVAAVKGQDWKQGDIIAFWHHNKILIKRLVAEPGSRVDMGEDGTVYVDESPLPETYLAEKSAGISSTQLPCTVPEGCYFVLGDAREISADSRNAQIGCIPKEQVVGKIAFRLWGPDGTGIVW